MQKKFDISIELFQAGLETTMEVYAANKCYLIMHNNLLFCTLKKIKNIFWCGIEGDLKQEIVELCGKAIDEKLETSNHQISLTQSQ
jgi:hypothetical protein